MPDSAKPQRRRLGVRLREKAPRFLALLAAVWLFGTLLLFLEFPWDFVSRPGSWWLFLLVGPPAALLVSLAGELFAKFLFRLRERSKVGEAISVMLWFAAIFAAVFGAVACEVVKELREEKLWQQRRAVSQNQLRPN